MIGITKEAQLKRTTKTKQKTCKKCGEQFEPIRPFQKCCTYSCAIGYAKEELEQKQNKEKRKTLKAFSSSDKATLLRTAQKTFNQYIRLRDGKHCISCGYDGSNAYNGDDYVGRKFDAGHFRSQGGNSALRFDENNCHAQCVQCNQFKSGNLSEYRIKLIQKIGIEEVERLETTPNTKRWAIEELKEIIDTYKQKIKEL